MKAVQMIKIVMVVLILCSGLIGCASKKATSQLDDQAKIGQADMSQPAEARGTVADASAASGVPTHEAVAGLERVHFDFDQFTLSAEARRILGENARYLNANSAVKVVIEGHCDERGSDEYNLALGESRALAAKNYLVSLGISATRLSVISYGEEKPLVSGANESAWAQNRRAEFKVVR